MNQDELKFKAVDAEGRQIDCETLFMFESPETKKNYIVYTDNSIDEEGNVRVYASIYNPADLRVSEGEEMAALELKKNGKLLKQFLKKCKTKSKKAKNRNAKET